MGSNTRRSAASPISGNVTNLSMADQLSQATTNQRTMNTKESDAKKNESGLMDSYDANKILRNLNSRNLYSPEPTTSSITPIQGAVQINDSLGMMPIQMKSNPGIISPRSILNMH